MLLSTSLIIIAVLIIAFYFWKKSRTKAMVSIIYKLIKLLKTTTNLGRAIKTDGELYFAIIGAFLMLRRSDELLINDYDFICEDELKVKPQLIPTIQTYLDAEICGNNLIGTNGELYLDKISKLSLSEIVETQRKWLGTIQVFPGAIMEMLKYISSKTLKQPLTEGTVLCFTAFVLGHERQHSLQTKEFIMQDRSNIEDTRNGLLEQIKYNTIPSELEASTVGLQYAQQIMSALR